MTINIIVLILTLIIAFFELKKDKDGIESAKKSRFSKGIFIVVFLIFILSIINICLEDAEEKRNLQKQTELYEKLLEKADNIIDSTKTIVFLQDKLFDANSEIRSLQKRMINEITGDGSIPQISPNIYGNIYPNDIGFDIYNQSKYPMTDIKVTVEDYAYLANFGNLNYEERQKASNSAKTLKVIGTLASNTGSFNIYRIKIPPTIKKVEYGVTVNWKYGNYNRNFVFERDSTGLFKVINY